MTKSMTGFGKAIFDNDEYAISVEIKSLNSKFLELNLRLPKQFSDKELEVRNMFSEKLVRGKINVFVEFERKSDEKPKNQINKVLMKAYYDELKDASEYIGETNNNLFNTCLNMPDVVKRVETNDDTNDSDWDALKKIIFEALTKINQFRVDEAQKLNIALVGYSKNISSFLEDIQKEEKPRKEAFKDKIRTQLNELDQKYDENRFEQELIYYLEKLDITEEKVRLRSHLEYFEKELNGDGGGKKLGFIAQEIGREINTIGSKANYVPIQHAVVKMKDELEKIKEQVLNLV